MREEIESFLNAIYGEATGFAYSPTKAKTGTWNEYYFEWPTNKEELITHIVTESKTKDIYISPGLFHGPKARKTHFKGSNFVWAEFDGNIPTKFDSLEPTIRIRTSNPGHEHWYWRLDKFTTDIQLLEDISKRITYYFDADRSGWDATQVLRPPGTTHQESKKHVSFAEDIRVGHSYSPSAFEHLPKVPDQIQIEIDLSKLPSLESIVLKYSWTPDAIEIFQKTYKDLGPIRKRSEAMTRFAFECVEMGMSNEEIFRCLVDLDDRLKKFINRNDRSRRLSGIINYVRAKKGYQQAISLAVPYAVFRFKDFLDTEVKFEWIVQGLLEQQGLLAVAGPSGTGKTQFSLQLSISLASGQERFLDWTILKPQRILFVSLEMNHAGLKSFLETMSKDLLEPQLDRLQENLFLFPVGHALPFQQKDERAKLLDVIDSFGITGVVIDSYGVFVNDSLKEEQITNRLIDFLNKDLRTERECYVHIIHHPRKSIAGQPAKPRSLDDILYGNQYLSVHTTTVLGLYHHKGTHSIDVDFFKSRFSEVPPTFKIERTENLNFRRLTKIDKTGLSAIQNEEPKLEF